MRHIFTLKNHTKKLVEKLASGPFQKNHNGAYLWINVLKFYTACFNRKSKFYSKDKVPLYHLSLPHLKLSQKTKRSSELVFFPKIWKLQLLIFNSFIK